MLDDYRIRKVLKIVADDPPISVPELARLVNLSSSRVGHLFRLHVGIDLESYLRNARLQRAAELLQQTELSIKEISAKVGYSHASSFDRGFRSKFDVEPVDYRRQHRS